MIVNAEAAQVPIAPLNDIVGCPLKAYVQLERVIFPKKASLMDIVPGEFGIIKVNVQTILDGALVEEDGFFSKGANTCLSLKGNIPQLEYNVMYYFEGVLQDDAKWGLQYQIKQLHKVYKLEKVEHKEVFLRTILGDSKASLIMKYFPEDPFKPFEEEDIKSLCAIKGIGTASAETMLRKFKANIDTSGDLVRLQEYGLTPNSIARLQAIFKSTDSILYILENNPYALIDMVDGIGWEKADAIALNGGYNPYGENRVKAYTKFLLKNFAESEGHSWINIDTLINAIKAKLPNLLDTELQNWFRKWTGQFDEKQHWLYWEPETRRIGLMYYRKLEEQIAQELLRLQHAHAIHYDNEEIETAIQEAENIAGFQYTEEQRDAIYKCLKNNVSITVGSAGVGKTSIMLPVVRTFIRNGIGFAQCALSGKASSNLSEITNQEGYTIHRLLEYNPMVGGFQRTRSHPLGFGAIILDELSLVGGEIFLSLLKAIPNGSKLIMLGDSNQLESIGLTNLLKDIQNSHIIPTTTLLKIHRQAARSGIITESLKASAGEQIIGLLPTNETRGELQDLIVNTYSDSILSQETIIEEYKHLYYDMKIPVKDIGVVVPMRTKGTISCLALNILIQEMVNSFITNEEVTINKKEGNYILRKYDKIIIIKNNYGTKNRSGQLVPIFNGNTGFIKEIDIENKEIIVELAQQGEVVIEKNDWNSIELGYAITAHKCQGSSYPYVIVGLDMSAYTLLSKEWLYTAMTRAKKMCILVLQIKAGRRAVTISRVSVKQTWLQELLIEYANNYNETKVIRIDDTNLDEYKEFSEEIAEALAKQQ